MAGLSFKIDVNDAPIRAALAGLDRAARNLAPAMDEIGALLVLSAQRRFESGTGPDGTPWKPSQRALRQGGQTLVDSARLLQSLTYNFGADFAEAGTNVIYAAIHQFGGPTGRGQAVDMPARPFLGVDDGDRDEILNILRDHLLDGSAAGAAA